MDKKQFKRLWKKTWHFIWEDNSIWSWIVNIILAFVIIKFIVYPVLGLALSTSHPIVAVVSGSMEHFPNNNDNLCGINTLNYKNSFDNWWIVCGDWYTDNGISKEQFKKFPSKNGFNTGDIMILYRTKIKDIKPGQVIVFRANRPDPIIHRVVKKSEANNMYYMQTKGDHNENSYPFEQNIGEEQYIGRAALRIPFLGYIKIWFVNIIKFIISIF